MSGSSLHASGLTANNNGKIIVVQAQDAHFSRSDDLNDVLNSLPVAKKAPFNAYDRQHESVCLPDTRVDLLQEIYNWADGKDGQDERCIFWLNGLAGTGKSTISRTVARRYNEQKRLGASFFFSKGGGDVSHASKFFTSLAVQLAYAVPSLQTHIRGAVSERSDISNLSLLDQWRLLVFGPLSRLENPPRSYVLVVDALDECEGDKNIRLILKLLAEARLLKTVRLRIFLTSRPEIPIRHGIRQIPQAEHQDFILHDVPSTIINHDISLFLEHNLGRIGDEWTLGADWPGEVVLRKLVLYACGLFIWAATACRFITKGEEFAKDRLYEILANIGLEGTPEQHLDQIYLTVLQSSIPNTFRLPEKERLRAAQRKVLGSIVILLSPLSASCLENLISTSRPQVTQTQVTQTLERLQAIIDVPKEITNSLRLHHPSFRDFLLNKDRCGDFWVDEKETHQILATSCIQLMSQTLKKDVCEMYAPDSQASQVESSRLQRFLPPEVQYACVYWVQHLQRSSSQVHDSEEVHQFLEAHLLHWLEALGWIGKVSEGIQAILSLEACVSATKSPNLHAFIHDARRFALCNRSVIERAPLQVYCSALIFAPEKSIIRETFEKYFPTWIQRKPKVQAHWSMALQTFEGHSGRVNSVAFSPDGTQVVSGSDDDTVRLWDAATGAPLQTLKGHSSGVTSVAFSIDSTQVASGSWDSTIQLWDSATGAPLQTLKGHSSRVTLVAFSPDGTQIISGSDDNTERLWDAASGAPLQTLEGHPHGVSSAVFLSDGTQVVLGSWDSIVRLWDIATGAPLLTLEGHLDRVTSVAFSPDGTQLASSSDDYTVRLWDVATRAPLQTLKGHLSGVTSVAFSPDGTQVVSGSDDETVRLWDVVTRAPLQTLEGHSSLVSSVAFSPDGTQVASGSNDNTVRLWDTATGAPLQTLKGHLRRVTSVAFSTDSTQVVSGSDDETVRLWNTAVRAPLQTLKGHSSWVSSVAFSPDGTQVVSGSDDSTVRLWDVATGASLQTFKGHPYGITSVAFSPNSTQVVSGSWDSTVRLWDTATGALLQTLEGHLNRVTSVAFSPNGTQVVSGSDDNIVRLWEAATGVPLQTLEGNPYSVSLAAFSPDGTQVPVLRVVNHWLVEGSRNILWLPADYCPTCEAAWGRIIVLGLASGRLLFLQIQQGPKLII